MCVVICLCQVNCCCWIHHHYTSYNRKKAYFTFVCVHTSRVSLHTNSIPLALSSGLYESHSLLVNSFLSGRRVYIFSYSFLTGCGCTYRTLSWLQYTILYTERRETDTRIVILYMYTMSSQMMSRRNVIYLIREGKNSSSFRYICMRAVCLPVGFFFFFFVFALLCWECLVSHPVCVRAFLSI